MPKYFCDYCDTFLTHDSPSVRKTHCSGQRHKDAVRGYYQSWLEEQVQKLVDHASEAYKSGKVPNPVHGGAMNAPPMGMPPMNFPRYPPMMGAPGYPPAAPPMMPGVRPPPQRWGN